MTFDEKCYNICWSNQATQPKHFTEEIVMPPVCDTMAYPVPSAGPTSVSTGANSAISAAAHPALGHATSSLFGHSASLGVVAHRLGEHPAFGGGNIPPTTTTPTR